MKILTSQQIREADQFTIDNEPILPIDLMERASLAFVNSFIKRYKQNIIVNVFCGVGNNGGDGLAIGRILHEQGYHVKALQLGDDAKASPSFIENKRRFPSEILKIEGISDFPDVGRGQVIIDGLFGSGLNKPIKNLGAEIVTMINSCSVPVVSIDIASGLYGESILEDLPIIIEPTLTICFQVPKLAFFQPGNSKYVGEFELVDIGLNSKFIQDLPSNYQLVRQDEIQSLIPSRDHFMHKGQAGRVELWAGAKGKMGAAVLAAKACLRSGAGLLYMKVPKSGNDIIQAAIPEAMVKEDIGEENICSSEFTENADVIGIGPGIGQSKATTQAVRGFLERLSTHPRLVIDADGLNILANDTSLLELLPRETILTPHPKEFERLVGTWGNDYEKLELLKTFCKKHIVNVVLKGAWSVVCNSKGRLSFNSTGNPGMATAGSGDVLFGIVSGLLAQMDKPEEALILGVFLHGRAGDLAKTVLGEHSLIAGDLIGFLPKAFLACKP